MLKYIVIICARTYLCCLFASYLSFSISSSFWKISYFNFTIVCKFENMVFHV